MDGDEKRRWHRVPGATEGRKAIRPRQAGFTVAQSQSGTRTTAYLPLCLGCACSLRFDLK